MSLKKSWIWLLIPLIYTVLLLPAFVSVVGYKKLVLSGQIAIVWISCLAIHADKNPFSASQLFWIFNLVFFGILPSYQIASHRFPWYQQFEMSTCLYANLVTLSCLLTFLAVRLCIDKIKIKYLHGRIVSEGFLKRYRYMGTYLFFLCCLSIVLTVGFENLWLRRLTHLSESRFSITFQLLFFKTLRGAVLYFTLLTVWLYRLGKISLQRVILILAACLLSNFPLSLSRYFMATLYGSIIVSTGWKWLFKKNFILPVLLILLLIVYPILSITRYPAEQFTRHLRHPGMIFREAIIYGEFDPYSSLCRTIDFVQQNGHTGGRQLAGVLLFFVPRPVWKDKPVGSGSLVYSDYTILGKNFRNISSPLYAEGFINFGWGGSLAFIAVLAAVIRLYDNYYWRNSERRLTYLYIFYPACMLMIFFMLRGDLLSSFAYTAGFFVSGLIFHKLLTGVSKRGVTI